MENIANILSDANTVKILLRKTMQWYGEVMRNALLRYKILFIFIVALLAPTIKVLCSVLTVPAVILLIPTHSSSMLFIICLLGVQLFSLIWAMIHQLVVTGRPWDKYLSSLHISNFQKMMVDILMLLVFDALIWIPILYIYVLHILQNNIGIVNVLVLFFRSIILIEIIILAQVSFLKRRGVNLFFILFFNATIIISSYDFKPILQLISSLSLIPIMYLLILSCYRESLSRIGKMHTNQCKLFFSSASLFYLLLRSQFENLSQLSMMLFLPIVSIFIVSAMRFYAADIPVYSMIISVMMLVNALSLSNVFKHLHKRWGEYSSYTQSLPISRMSLLYACLLIGVSFVLLFNIAILLISGFNVPSYEFIMLGVGFLISLFYLLAAYLPQVKAGRYGLIVSFLLMFIFIYADNILINSLG